MDLLQGGGGGWTCCREEGGGWTCCREEGGGEGAYCRTVVMDLCHGLPSAAVGVSIKGPSGDSAPLLLLSFFVPPLPPSQALSPSPSAPPLAPLSGAPRMVLAAHPAEVP